VKPPSFDLQRPGRRALEIATGSVAWLLISSPIWAAFLAPDKLSYFLLIFNSYWLYKSATTAICAVIGYRRLGAAQETDWLSRCRGVRGWEHMHHLVLIPTYGEPTEVLESSLWHLAQQDYPAENIWVVLAFEARDPEARARSAILLHRHEGQFAGMWATFHQDRPGEVRGKSSNLAYAGRWAKERLVDDQGFDLQNVLVTVCDADSRLHARYLSALTHEFLTDADGRQSIFQPALMFYANFWRIPPVVRMMAGLQSVWQLARLVTPYKLITQSTYSLSLSTCHGVGYWDPDVIPEDSRMFFKVLFALRDGVRVRPIFLPVYADAAEGPNWYRTLINQYRQIRRWAWGVSDVPYLLWRLVRQTEMPLWRRLSRVALFTEEHISWPSHWFLLTLGAHAPAFLAPAFTLTPLGQSLSTLAQIALTLCLPCLALIMWIDNRLQPPRFEPRPWWRDVLSVASWALLPIAGLLLTAIPALEAHTRLLFGRYLQYQVTEKLPGEATLVPDWSGGAEAA
jgi:cellulose synthase/poly-beta-1,6-N-acetylglucosamine synthase-like glycosyltransferase